MELIFITNVDENGFTDISVEVQNNLTTKNSANSAQYI